MMTDDFVCSLVSDDFFTCWQSMDVTLHGCGLNAADLTLK